MADENTDFGALLAELDTQSTVTDTMVKAMADSDEFERGEDGKPKLDADGKPVKKGAAAAEGTMAKSFSVTLPSGETTDAIDATDMLKALSGDMDTMRTALPKMLGIIKQQGDMMKAMQADLTALRTSGTGRRSTVLVHEKTTAAAGAGSGSDMHKAHGMSPGDFMAKALDAVKDGRLNSMEAAMLDSQMGRGLQPDASVVARVLGAKSYHAS